MRASTQGVGDRMKDRWGPARMSSLDRQNMRLRDEVSHLRIQLEDERTATHDLKDVLRSGPRVVKVKRRGGLLRLAVVGGAAYIVGTKHGRERYDQIAGWVRSMRSKLERNADEVVSELEADTSQMPGGAGRTVTPTPPDRVTLPEVMERRSGSPGTIP